MSRCACQRAPGLGLLDLEAMKADELDGIKREFIELDRRNEGNRDDPSHASTAEA